MFPDYKGQVITGDMGKKLLEFQKNSKHEIILLSIINGVSGDELGDVLRSSFGYFERITCARKGLTHTLLYGYEWIIEKNLDKDYIVVRFDPDEHPIDQIEDIALLTQNINDGKPGMSIYEFHLDKKIASEDEIFVNENIFPNMYETYTNGKLSLTNTHGFQAFAPETISKILPMAKKIVEFTEEYTNEILMWGMDAIMALSAVYHPHHLLVYKKTIRPEKIRDRPIEKISKQIENHARLLMVARKILNRK